MRPLIRSRRVAIPLAALALAGTGVAAYGAVGDDSVDYRTVSATTGSVEQELSLSGTISPSGSSELAFGTAGTVAKVRVEQGDEVEEGDVIAVLDRASLRAAVDRAASDLASAKAQLADDRDAQTTAVTTSTSSSSSSSGGSQKSGSGSSSSGSGAPASGGSGSTAAVVKQLTAQQDAVLEAQTTASTALSAAETALADQQTACADPVTTTETTDAATDAATDGTTADAGTTTTTAVLSEECTSALAAVQAAQATAAEAQTTLQTALETLGSTVTQALGSVQAGTSTGSGGSTGGASTPTGSGASGATGSTGSTGSSAAALGGSSAGQTVTAATLAQDQASIDRAKADLASAKADLAGAVVRAPADGTVVSLAVATADDVSAGDTVATVVAPGLTTVTVEASATQAAQLEQGMDVEVTPAGATEALAGGVSRIEHVASSDSSTSSDPTYTVAIALDERDLQLADGMPASVTAVVGAADDVVVVPASAVNNGSVTVLDNGVAQQVRVSTGIVGATQIEVTDGLEAGEEVVLADLDAELPTGDTEQQGGFGGGGFGGGGGGFPAGGPPSGGFPR